MRSTCSRINKTLKIFSLKSTFLVLTVKKTLVEKLRFIAFFTFLVSANFKQQKKIVKAFFHWRFAFSPQEKVTPTFVWACFIWFAFFYSNVGPSPNAETCSNNAYREHKIDVNKSCFVQNNPHVTLASEMLRKRYADTELFFWNRKKSQNYSWAKWVDWESFWFSIFLLLIQQRYKFFACNFH